MHRRYCAICGSPDEVALIQEPITPICASCYRQALAADTERSGGALYRLTPAEWNEFTVLRGRLARRIEITKSDADRLRHLERCLIDQTPLSVADNAAARRIVALALGG